MSFIKNELIGAAKRKATNGLMGQTTLSNIQGNLQSSIDQYNSVHSARKSLQGAPELNSKKIPNTMNKHAVSSMYNDKVHEFIDIIRAGNTPKTNNDMERHALDLAKETLRKSRHDYERKKYDLEQYSSGRIKDLQDKLQQSHLDRQKDKDISRDQISKLQDQLRSKEPGAELKRGLAIGAGVLGSGILIGGAVHLAGKAYSRFEANQTWKWLEKNHPEISSTPQDKELFNILVEYSPDLAANHNVAFSYLSRARQLGMTPHEFIKDLVSIQDSRNRSAFSSVARDFAMRNVFRG